MKPTPAVLALLLGAGTMPAQTPRNYTVDLENRYPAVGALLIVATDPNPVFPVGLVAFCSGVLVHEVAFLTAGHCVGPSQPALPPFIKAYVSFNSNALDASTWIPVRTQVPHPSLPPCPPPEGCDSTFTDAFKSGDPAVTDLGLAILSRPAGVKPAKLASPELLDKEKVDGIPMSTVGYGRPVPDRLMPWDGLRKYRLSELATVLNGVWGAWALPSSVCYGDSGAPTFFDQLPAIANNHETIVAIASDGGADCLSKDNRVRVDTLSVHQWIKQTIDANQ
jgi:hypothetical protein